MSISKELELRKPRSFLDDPVWIFRPSDKDLKIIPEFEILSGAIVTISKPYNDTPVLHWMTTQDGTRYKNVAFPLDVVAHSVIEARERLKRERKSNKDPERLFIGPFIVLRTTTDGDIWPVYYNPNSKNDGSFMLWKRALHLKQKNN